MDKEAGAKTILEIASQQQFFDRGKIYDRARATLEKRALARRN